MFVGVLCIPVMRFRGSEAHELSLVVCLSACLSAGRPICLSICQVMVEGVRKAASPHASILHVYRESVVM